MKLVSDDKERWTEEGVRTLARAFPEDVRTADDGTLVPLITPREMHARRLRYPSAFEGLPDVDRSAPDATLRARFPSMFKA